MLGNLCKIIVAVSLANWLFPASSAAQFPGNIHIGIAGRGFNLQGNIPSEKIADLFKSGELRFQESVLQGDVRRAERWVKPEFVDAPIKGLPPVYFASAQGNTAMVELLAKNGANMKCRFNHKSLAFVAAYYGHSTTANALVALHGGEEEDVSKGHALYAANEAEHRREAKVATALALGAVVAMIESSSSSSSSSHSGPSDDDNSAAANYYRAMHPMETMGVF